MKALWVLAVYLTAVFAAPATDSRPSSVGDIWDFHSPVFTDFEENLRRMREEFEQLEKNLESQFKFPNPDGFGNNAAFFPNVFDIDPSKVKNESFSDTKVELAQELRAPLEVRNAESDAISEVADNDLYESGSNVYPSQVVDLSNDTKVNDILTENIKSGGLIQPDPDAEIIEINTNNINNKPTYDAARNFAYDPRYYYHYGARPLN